MFEETFLFSATVRENIAFAKPDASDAEIEAAARSAQAHDFIAALPGGYATRVGERGYTLSGGQRQRIALARAALANPPVLILDDATSAVDARTEEAIHRSFDQLLGAPGERTTILVAHRHSTLRLATRVIVLADGKIVAEGTNAHLAATCPLYRELLVGHAWPELGSVPQGQGAIDDSEAGLSVVDGSLDPAAWPARGGDGEGADERRLSTRAEIDFVAAKISGGGGGGGGGGNRDLGGNRAAAFVKATPELLAQVAALPPLRDEPAVDVAAATAPDAEASFGRLVRPFRGALLVGLALVVADALTTLAGPFLTGRAIDRGIVAGDGRALAGIAAVYLALQVASWLNARAMQVSTGRTAENLLFSLRARTFAHLQRLSLDFYDREMGGRIMTRMTTDVEALAQLLQQGLLTAVVSLLACAGVMVVLLGLEPRLAAAAFTVLPALVVGTALFRRWSADAYLRARDRISAVNAEMQEGLAGVRVTQAFSRQARSHQRFAALSQSYRDARFRSMRLIAFYFPFLQFLSVLGKAITLGVGARAHRPRSAQRRGAGGVPALPRSVLHPAAAALERVRPGDPGPRLAGAHPRAARHAHAHARGHRRDRSRPTAGRGALRRRALRLPEGPGGASRRRPAGQRRARWWRWSARPARASRRSSSWSRGSTTRPAGRCSSTGGRSGTSRSTAYRRQLGYVPQEPFLFSGTIRSNIALRPARRHRLRGRARRARRGRARGGRRRCPPAT